MQFSRRTFPVVVIVLIHYSLHSSVARSIPDKGKDLNKVTPDGYDGVEHGLKIRVIEPVAPHPVDGGDPAAGGGDGSGHGATGAGGDPTKGGVDASNGSPGDTGSLTDGAQTTDGGLTKGAQTTDGGLTGGGQTTNSESTEKPGGDEGTSGSKEKPGGGGAGSSNTDGQNAQQQVKVGPSLAVDVIKDPKIEPPATDPNAETPADKSITCKLRRWLQVRGKLQVRACYRGVMYRGGGLSDSGNGFADLRFRVQQFGPQDYRLSYLGKNHEWLEWVDDVGGAFLLPYEGSPNVHQVALERLDETNTVHYFVYDPSKSHSQGILIDADDKPVQLPNDEPLPKKTASGAPGNPKPQSPSSESEPSFYDGARRDKGVRFMIRRKDDGALHLYEAGTRPGQWYASLGGSMKWTYRGEKFDGTWLIGADKRAYFFHQFVARDPSAGELLEFNNRRDIPSGAI